MEWPPCFPDLNPIEHVWSMIKGKIYSAEKQYNTKDALWDAIATATKELMVNFLISFYDWYQEIDVFDGLKAFLVISNGSSYVKY